MKRIENGKSPASASLGYMVVGLVTLAIPLTYWISEGWQFDCFMPVLGGFGFLLLLKGMRFLVQSRMAKSRLGRAEVSIEPYPPRIGAKLRVQVKQMAWAGLSIEGIVARLWCEEWQNSNISESGRERTETVFNQEQTLSEAHDVMPGTEIMGEGAFVIPGDLKNSFVRGDHSVHWHLEIQTRVRSWPDAIMRHELNVKAAPGQREEESEEE